MVRIIYLYAEHFFFRLPGEGGDFLSLFVCERVFRLVEGYCIALQKFYVKNARTPHSHHIFWWLEIADRKYNNNPEESSLSSSTEQFFFSEQILISIRTVK